MQARLTRPLILTLIPPRMESQPEDVSGRFRSCRVSPRSCPHSTVRAPIATLLGFLLLGETLSSQSLVGASLIFVALLVAASGPDRDSTRAE